MKKRMICLFLTIFMVLALTPSVFSAEETTVDVVIRGSEWDRLEVAAMNLLNNFREEDGFTALQQNETLTDFARQRAAEVNLYYTPDHTRPDGSPAESILEGRHDGYTVFQELIAIGPATGAEAMEYWMNDEASRAILFSEEFTNIGVGTFESSGTICWVALLTDCDTGWGSGEFADECAMRFVSIFPDRIQQDLTGEMEITIPTGEEPTFYFTVSNPGWEGLHAVISPCSTLVSGSDWLYFGCYQDQDGRTAIISNDVVGSYVFRIGCYHGDPGDLELTIHVVDEEVPEYIPGHEHTPATLRQREAVCNMDGYTGTTYCTECHFILSDGAFIDRTEHSNTEMMVTRYPDWETGDQGNRRHYCTICGTTWDDTVFNGEQAHEDGHAISVICPENLSYIQNITHARAGHEVFILANTERGYEFADASIVAENGESVDLTVDGQYIWFTMPDCPVEVTLHYTELPSYQIHAVAGEGGKVNAELKQAYEGEEVYVFVDAMEGYMISDVTFSFQGSYEPEVHRSGIEDLVSDMYWFTMPDGDVTVTATFEPLPKHSIMVLTTDGGSAALSTESACEGESVILTLYPDEGYRVDQVLSYSYGSYNASGTQISDNEVEIIMPDGDVIIEVYFVTTVNPFNDVKKSDYFYEPVLWAVSNDITSGVGNGRFAPNNSCTRAQVVTFLWRAAGKPEPASNVNPFTDVKESDYFYKAVLWAVENNITSGISANKFGPNSPCTRAQVVTFLWRAAGKQDPVYGYNPFKDVKTTDYYYNAVLWAVEYGITSGISETRFGPNQACTRGQVVSFLYRFLHG